MTPDHIANIRPGQEWVSHPKALAKPKGLAVQHKPWEFTYA